MREKLLLALGIAYVLVLVGLSGVLVLGLPIALLIGVMSGDWIWLLAWALFALVAWIADKLGWVKPINDDRMLGDPYVDHGEARRDPEHAGDGGPVRSEVAPSPAMAGRWGRGRVVDRTPRSRPRPSPWSPGHRPGSA